MIRVLHVVTAMNRAGLESMIMNYYRHIDRSLVQFDFLTHRSGKFDYSEEIEQMGGKIYHLPRLNPFSKSYYRALSSFFEHHSEYKIIHVHQNCLSSVILRCAKEYNVPIRIAHSHSSNQDKNLKYLIKLWYKRQIAKYATNLFACGEDAGKWMFGNADFKVLKNAIDVNLYSFDYEERIAIRKELGIDDTALVIGHVGRFMEVKNHEFLINIFSELIKKVDAKMILVGDGELRQAIEDKIAKLNLSDKVMLIGVKSNVHDYLQAMDVFVFPSLYEGLPLVIIEAQAAGLPCLISDKVPIECKITDYVEQISLRDTQTWVERILNYKNFRRQNNEEKISNAGYDINKTVKWLEKFYIERIN